MKTLFLVAGEVSGDHHAAALLGELDRDRFVITGLGGPRMRTVSEGIEDWLDQAAVLGLWEVLKKYRYFKDKMEETLRKVGECNPDGVLLVDYPGFNLRLARGLRRQGYRGKLLYYISPQVWAWKKGRVKVMAELLDLMICIFPFEKELYESSGLPTVFSGHPLVDSLEPLRGRGIAREKDLVALLPGSREKEIEALFPPMLQAARILRSRRPDLRFATSGASAGLTERLREMTVAAGLGDCEAVSESSREIMCRAQVGVVASGTATLEAAILGLPYCLTYRVAWLTAFAARRVIRVKFLGIVNVIAGREVVRELLQEEATGESIAGELNRLLEDEDARERLRRELAEVVVSLGDAGAHRKAASAVAEALGESGET